MSAISFLFNDINSIAELEVVDTVELIANGKF